MKLFVDLDGYPNPGECFASQHPDIVIINGKEVIVIELSVCYETQFQTSDHRFRAISALISAASPEKWIGMLIWEFFFCSLNAWKRT